MSPSAREHGGGRSQRRDGDGVRRETRRVSRAALLLHHLRQAPPACHAGWLHHDVFIDSNKFFISTLILANDIYSTPAILD